MKTVIAFIFTIILSLLDPYQNNEKPAQNYQISTLLSAEKKQDINLIRKCFLKDAVITLPDSPPIAGIPAISSLYEYLWEKPDNETLDYKVDSVFQSHSSLVEYGQLISLTEDNKTENIPFRASFRKIHENYRISKLSFGGAKSEDNLPQLPQPTGKYNIGQDVYFYNDSETTNNRELSFQIWFPSKQNSGKKYAYRSTNTAIEAARFLGWPLFGNSFVTLIESHSYIDASPVPNKRFPVLIYNHGYGGFSGVYQTVFEELASHGYIVVSVGHQDESALLMVDDDKVIPNSPENQFYSKRAAELNGQRINELQSVILNSDNILEVKNAYNELLEKSPLHNESVELWTNDTKEVIKKLNDINRNDRRLKGAFDLNKIGVFGHSLGGATAGELAFSCPDVKAGINLDGFQFGNLINNQLQVPFMFLSGNSSGESYLRVYPFFQNSVQQCHHAVLKGFTHDMFSDLVVIVNQNERAIQIQRKLILDFFDYYLKNRDINLFDVANRFDEVTFLR